MKHNNKQILFKIIFCISLPFLTFLLSTLATKIEIIIGMILSFLIAIFLSFKVFKDMYEKINLKYLVFSLIISLYLERIFILYSGPINDYINRFLLEKFNIYFLSDNLSFLLVILSLPSLLSLIYIFIKWIIPLLDNEYKKMSKDTKKVTLVILIIGFALSFIIYNLTTCFTNPTYTINGVTYDHIFSLIYSSDNSYIFSDNAYLNFNMAANDIRSPLFGLFAMPFAIIAYIISDILFFIPNGYAVILNTIQIGTLFLSVLMIMKMLNLDDRTKIIYIIYSFCTFPLIIFSFIMEQYIFSLFYLILTIYIYYNKKFKINYAYIGAVGTMLTSGVIFPLISKFKNFKNWIINTIKCFITFVCIVIITGRLHTFLDGINCFNSLMRFTGKNLTFYDKFLQYLNFVKSMFFAPSSRVIYNYEHIPQYALSIVTTLSITGIIILVLCTISFILNRKNKFATISFLWIIFSFVLLCLFGWGTSGNELFLYSLYFSWAYLILIFLLIDKLFKNKKVRNIIIIILCIILLIFNIPGFIEVLKFGMTYYR